MTRKLLLNIFTIITVVTFAWPMEAVSAAQPPVTATPARWLTITSPNGGEVLSVGSVHRITWNSSTNIDRVFIAYKACLICSNWIATNLPNTGYYDWNVFVGSTRSTQFRIQVIGYQTGVGSVVDTSDAKFTVNQLPKPTRTPTKTRTLTPTKTPTITKTPTWTTTWTPTDVPADTATITPSDTPTVTPSDTATITPSETPTITPSNTATITPSDTPTVTSSDTATSIPSDTPTLTPTETTIPTNTPVPSCSLLGLSNTRFINDDFETSVTNNNVATAYLVDSSLNWMPTPLTGGKYLDYLQFGDIYYNPSTQIIDSPVNVMADVPDLPIAGGAEITWLADFSGSIFGGSWSVTLTFNFPGWGDCILTDSIDAYTSTPTTTRTATRTITSTRTPSSTPTPTDTVTIDPSVTETATSTSTATRTPTRTRTITRTPTNTIAITPTNTRTPTATRTVTRTATNTFTPTSTVTRTQTPTVTSTFVPTPTLDPIETETLLSPMITPDVSWITLNSPVGREVLTYGDIYPITWQSSADIELVDIVILYRYTCSGCLSGWDTEWSIDLIPNTGSYDWTVYVDDPANKEFIIIMQGEQFNGSGYSVVAMYGLEEPFTVNSFNIPTFTLTPSNTYTVTPTRTITRTSTPTQTTTSTITRTSTRTPTSTFDPEE